MSTVPVYIPSPYNIFLYFLGGQVHKDSKLGIMTNAITNRLVKVIFTNIHEISDAFTNVQFGIHHDCIQVMHQMLFNFLWKNGISEKIKVHLSSTPLPLAS